jgi:hypothetical protein
MDPKIYENRARHKSLPLDFQYQDAASYSSNWEYIKDNLSNYHYDKWRKESEGEWWHILGRFIFSDEIRDLVLKFEEESKKVGWFDVTSTYHPGFPGGRSPLLDQEDYDRQQSGIQGEYTQVVPEPEMVDTAIQKLGTYWKMKRLRTRLHFQYPGQMFAMHVDKLWHRNPSDPSKIIRIVVNLKDYEPGQLMIYGNNILTQWQEGDIHCFDTLNVPHATANLSTKVRPIMVITGIRTEETDKILSASDSASIHVIP